MARRGRGRRAIIPAPLPQAQATNEYKNAQEAAFTKWKEAKAAPPLMPDELAAAEGTTTTRLPDDRKQEIGPCLDVLKRFKAWWRSRKFWPTVIESQGQALATFRGAW